MSHSTGSLQNLEIMMPVYGTMCKPVFWRVEVKVYRWLCLCLIATTVGCSFSDYESPNITVTNLQFSNVTFFETGLAVDVRFQNPNEVDIEVIRGKHELELNGVDIGTGYNEGRFTIPAYGSVVQPVSFSVSNLGVLARVQTLLDATDLTYEVVSQLKTDRGSFSVTSDGSVTGVR